MKSSWKTGAFRGLTDRLVKIKGLWQQVIDLELEEIKRKAENLQNVAEQVKIAKMISGMDRSELRGKVISDDLD